MYQLILEAHSGLRYAVMILLVVAIILSLLGWFGGKKYTSGNKNVNLFTLISVHIQFVLGLVIYFLSPYVGTSDMSSAMKDSTLRYWTVEHGIMMVIAIILVTIGYSKSKRVLDDLAKHRTISLFYIIAFVIIIVAIVHSGRPVIGS